MRELADAARIRRFLHELGRAASESGDCYLAGGTTAVLLGWRETTLDVDIHLEPEQDVILRAIPRLKDELAINVELASPRDFIPLPSGWRDRSLFVEQAGQLALRHFDPVSQTLSKLERGHAQDLEDARTMLERGLVDEASLRAAFEAIEPELYRFPAIDPAEFHRRVDAFLGT